MKEPKICPICENGELTMTASFSQEGIPLLYSVCSHCESEQGGEIELEVNRILFKLFKEGKHEHLGK
jgi:hypothetical protein